ncbi:MAG: hypothetical protein EBR58_13580 [Betaproteobacteria bacterium]|nr:hypothetical protein [Betaproteobacteria bacterium]
MTHEIKSFFWGANADNCIAILNYEFQGVTEVSNDSFQNDESPSASFTINEKVYKLFFPSDYQGDYSQYVLFDSTDYMDEILLGEFVTIADVIAYFKSINVI